MAQFKKIVFGAQCVEAPKGMTYEVRKGNNDELIIALVNVDYLNTEDVSKEEKISIQITRNDIEKVKCWLGAVKTQNYDQSMFKKRVEKAIRVVNGGYELIMIKNRKKLSYNQWENVARNYDLERESRSAKLSELVIYQALGIVNNKWTLTQITSSNNTIIRNLSKADETILNECKIVNVDDVYKEEINIPGQYWESEKNLNRCFALLGGDYEYASKTKVVYLDTTEELSNKIIGVVSLTK